MPFDEIAGQERAKSQIAAWLRAGRLPQTVLISGREGTGKRRLALELARAINCREGGVDACGRCPSCIKAAARSHPDMHFLLPLAARRDEAEEVGRLREAAVEYLDQHQSVARSNTNIAREHIRLLQREMSYAPSESRWRVALIFEADCMHRAGANSLLKILEEPPRHAVFVLTSSAPDSLLPTILSRCQRLHLLPLGAAEIRARLAAAGVPPDRAALAARVAAASLVPAEEAASEQFDQTRSLVEDFIGGGLAGRDDAFWALLEQLGSRSDRARLESFLAVCGTYLRDLFMLSQGRDAHLMHGDRRELLDQWLAAARPQRLEEAAVQVDRAYAYVAGNANPQLVLADLFRQVNRCRLRASAREG